MSGVERLVDVNQLTRVRRLELSNNLLQTIPPAVFDMRSLTQLDLSRNPLTSLDGIGRLPLRGLYINHLVSLSTLPRDIGQLTQLGFLSAMSCGLRSLPAEMGQLQSLQLLTVQDNKLSWLPCELDRLPATTRVFLRGNPLPVDVREPSPPYHSRGVLQDVFAATSALAMIREQATTMAIGLQELELPALVTLEIIDAAWNNDIPMHKKWKLITAVKHFQQRGL